MAKKKKVMFMGVDITEATDALSWRPTPSNKMDAAVNVLAENPDIKILQRLRAELIAHPKKYKDVCPFVFQPSNDPGRDIVTVVDRIIATTKNPDLHYIMD